MLHILKRTNGKQKIANTILFLFLYLIIDYLFQEFRVNDEELIELKLIPSKSDIENPKLIVNAKLIPKC